jgi:DNA-binding CsgD family transcriptional regulator
VPTEKVTYASSSPKQPSDDRASDRAISEQARTEVLAVIDKAGELLDSTRLPEAAEIYDLPTASAALASIWNGVRATMWGDRGTTDRLASAEDMLPLLIATKDAEDNVDRERSLKRSTMVRSVQHALGFFHQMSSVSELIDSTPSIVCSLGFDRAIVSRIDESMWITDALHIAGDREWAEQILEIGRMNPQRLVPNLFETEIVRRKCALLVRNVQAETRVHRPVADASLSRSYVAAPIMPRAQVIGFLHADRYFHRGELSEFDRDILAIFAEGFGYALERAILVERLAELRAKVLGFADGLTSAMTGGVEDQIALGRRRPDDVAREHSGAGPQFDDWPSDSRLTRREVDVLRLMAAGDTNHRIANKLIISEGTVKSHVKHILRKLNAANRAEAVSIWLHGEQQP